MIKCLFPCVCFHALCLIITYHQDMDKVSGGRVPHLQRQIVGCRDHRAVMTIPCYHGNLQLGHFVFQRRRVVLSGGYSEHDVIHFALMLDSWTPNTCWYTDVMFNGSNWLSLLYIYREKLNKRHIVKWLNGIKNKRHPLSKLMTEELNN